MRRRREREELVVFEFVFGLLLMLVLEITGIIIAIIAVCTKRTFFFFLATFCVGMEEWDTLSHSLSIMFLLIEFTKRITKFDV